MKALNITHAAEIAIQTFRHEELKHIYDWLDRLKNWNHDEVVREQSKTLAHTPDVYVLRTSENVRIFFTVEPERITILDVAKRATIMASGQVRETE